MNYLLKTQFGWCGIVFDDAVREIVLPSPDKQKVLQRLRNRGYSTNPDGFSEREPEGTASSEPGTGKIHSVKFRKSKPATGFLKGLRRYFNGEKVDFRCGIDLRDYSNFEQAVYKTLMAIPYGRVRTYQWVAQKAGSPRASRAVGNALAKNPLPIIIPCHRVIKSDGSLGNFSAIGGAKLKKKLLEMEKASPKEFGMAEERY